MRCRERFAVTGPCAGRLGSGPCSGCSGCCERGEWLAVLGAFLSRAVEQWLSSRTQIRFRDDAGGMAVTMAELVIPVVKARLVHRERRRVLKLPEHFSQRNAA